MGASDFNIAEASGSISGTGAAATLTLSGEFNILLSGFGTATIKLERSWDDGSNWYDVVEFTAADAVNGDIQKIVTEIEKGVMYRFNCTSYAAGPITWRISR